MDGPTPLISIDSGSTRLPNPRFDAIVDFKKNSSSKTYKRFNCFIKGIKAGTKDAQIAKTAGAKGTEKLKAAG